jgi:dTDP-glucose 4,6-dehydratase
VIITNTMNMFGQRQDPEKYIPMLIKKISAGQEVTIHGNDDFIGTRFYLHARNFADALLYLMTNTEPRMYEDTGTVVMPDRYNIVGEIEMNNLDLAHRVAALLKKTLYYQLVDFHKARAGHDRRYALDGTKMTKLGWKQPTNFDDSLRKTVEWTLRNPEWMR